MIPLKDQETLKLRFARELTNRVRVDFFSRKPSPIFIPGREECAACDDVRRLLRELAGLNLRISVTEHDLDDDAETAKQFGLERAPAIVLRGPANRPIAYFGSPISRQFTAFVELLVTVARNAPGLQPETVKTLRKLRSDVGIKLFVTPACAHSPLMVLHAARMALESPRLKLEIIDVSQFPQLAQRYYIPATPLTVFNDRFAVPAAMDEGPLAENLLLAAQGQQPHGGERARLTPFAPPQPQQQRRTSTSSSGLILPR